MRRAFLPTVHRPLPTRSGFTFIEVLFAVIILGIGMIMIAGMLPVAIKQGQESQQDLVGRAVCDNAYGVIRAMSAQTGAGAPTIEDSAKTAGQAAQMLFGSSEGALSATRYNFWKQIAGNHVSTSDSRFMWHAFWHREVGSSRVSLVILAAQKRDTEGARAMDGLPTDRFYDADFINLVDNTPHSVDVNFIDGSDMSTSSPAYTRLQAAGMTAAELASVPPDQDYVIFDATSFNPMESEQAVVEGMYLIVQTVGATSEPERNIGRVFKLAKNMKAGTGVWSLDPAYGLPSLAGGVPDASMQSLTNKATVLFLGRGLRDPSSPSGGANPYVGPAQDIAIQRYSFELGQ
ncbi:MAG: prepilin-type N-terminal cleavage/methylation domain-containing protein [Tepidisphaeraceae bacterium]